MPNATITAVTADEPIQFAVDRPVGIGVSAERVDRKDGQQCRQPVQRDDEPDPHAVALCGVADRQGQRLTDRRRDPGTDREQHDRRRTSSTRLAAQCTHEVPGGLGRARYPDDDTATSPRRSSNPYGGRLEGYLPESQYWSTALCAVIVST